MPRTIKFGKSWPYSLDGNTVLRAEPGDVVTLPDDLAAAAMAYGGQLEVATAPAAPERKDAPSEPVAPATDDPADTDEEPGFLPPEGHNEEPGNDGHTVPPAVAPKRTRKRK